MRRDHAKRLLVTCCSDPPWRFPGLTADVADREALLGLAAVLRAFCRVSAALACAACASFSPIRRTVLLLLDSELAAFALAGFGFAFLPARRVPPMPAPTNGDFGVTTWPTGDLV